MTDISYGRGTDRLTVYTYHLTALYRSNTVLHILCTPTAAANCCLSRSGCRVYIPWMDAVELKTLHHSQSATTTSRHGTHSMIMNDRGCPSALKSRLWIYKRCNTHRFDKRILKNLEPRSRLTEVASRIYCVSLRVVLASGYVSPELLIHREPGLSSNTIILSSSFSPSTTLSFRNGHLVHVLEVTSMTACH